MSITSIINKFKTYINSYSIYDKREKFNYVKVAKYGGKYYIPDEIRPEFLKKYSDAFNNTKHNFQLAQMPADIKPLVVDIDLRKTVISEFDVIETNYVERLINSRMVNGLIENYSNIFKLLYGADYASTLHNKYVYVMLRPKATKLPGKSNALSNADLYDTIKDGFHLVFPSIITTRATARFITDKIKEIAFNIMKSNNINSNGENGGTARENGVLSEYRKQKSPEVIDDAPVEKNPWMLYGSAKHKSIPYKIDYLIDLRDFRKIQCPNECDLPMILNLHGHKITTKITNQQAIQRITLEFSGIMRNKSIMSIMPLTRDKALDDYMIETIKSILDGLGSKYYNDYALWRNVGWCLKSVSGGDARVYTLWDNFSKKSNKYDSNVVYTTWSSGKDGVFTMGTLYHYLKTDNLTLFNEIKKDDIVNKVMKHKGGWSDYDIGKIAAKYLKSNFVSVESNATRGGSFMFYEFRDHAWHKLNGGTPARLRIILSKDIYKKIFCRAYMKLNEYMIRENGENGTVSIDGLKIKIDNIHKCMLWLRNQTRKRVIIDEIGIFLLDEEFFEKLNANNNLFGFKNGVYDFNKMEFRDGVKEDYISIQSNCNYIKDADPVCEQFKNIETFFRCLFPDEELYEYVISTLSCCMKGNDTDNQCYICIGCGGNGKSQMFNLIDKSFAKYYSSMKIEYFTQKGSSAGSANPEIHKLVGSRIVCSSEANKNETFNISKLKETTGLNRISYRPLWGGTIMDFMAQFRLWFQLNDLPHLLSVDRSIRRRIIVIIFKTVFTDDINEPDLQMMDKKYVKKIDPDLNDKINSWAYDGWFLTWLIGIYNTMVRGKKIIIPEIISSKTRAYIDENNHMMQYLKDTITCTNNADDSVNTTLLYRAYIRWIKFNKLNRIASTNKSHFRKFLLLHKKQYLTGCKLTHHKLITDDDDEISVILEPDDL